MSSLVLDYVSHIVGEICVVFYLPPVSFFSLVAVKTPFLYAFLKEVK